MKAINLKFKYGFKINPYRFQKIITDQGIIYYTLVKTKEQFKYMTLSSLENNFPTYSALVIKDNVLKDVIRYDCTFKRISNMFIKTVQNISLKELEKELSKIELSPLGNIVLSDMKNEYVRRLNEKYQNNQLEK